MFHVKQEYIRDRSVPEERGACITRGEFALAVSRIKSVRWNALTVGKSSWATPKQCAAADAVHINTEETK